MGDRAFLGEFEQMTLLAILRLRDQAFGPAIAKELEERAGRQVSRGALYATLDRLVKKGFVEWEIGAATSATRGNRRRRFSATEPGLEALRHAREAFRNLSEGLEGILSPRTP